MNKFLVLVSSVAVAALATSASAHHSAVQFDFT